jgi:hypothetical protein
LPETNDNVIGDIKVSGAKLRKGRLEIKQTNEVRIGHQSPGGGVGSDRNSEGDGYTLSGIQKS